MRFLTLLLLLFTVSVFAQPRIEKHYSYRHFTTYDGLAQSQVTRMVQDSKGYIWICTKGGLSRFDGKNFQNFVDDKDGQRINIQNIFEQKNDYIVCSGTKLWRFAYEEENPENWSFEDINIPQGYRFAGLNYFFFNVADSCYYLFNVTKPGYQKDQFIHIKINRYTGETAVLPLGEKYILCSYTENDRRIFLTSENKFVLINGTFITEKLPFTFDEVTLNPVDSTLIVYQKSTKTIFNSDKGLTRFWPICNNITIQRSAYETFIANTSGYLFFTNDFNGLNCIYKGDLIQVDKVTLVKCLLVDRENNLWLGTEEGIFNYFHLGFEQFEFNIGNSVDNVWSIICAPDSTMWFGGYLTGMWSLNKKGQLKCYNPANYIKPLTSNTEVTNFYMGAIRDHEGRGYLPVSHGMLKIEDNTIEYIQLGRIPMSITDDTVNNRLIIGSNEGFCLLQKGTWRITHFAKMNRSLVSTCIDRDGNPLLGSFGGQFIYSNDSLKPFRPEQNLGVISMVKDLKGNIWKGTPIGLYFDNGGKDSLVFAETIRGSVSAVFIKQPWLMVASVNKLFLVNIDSFYTNKTVEVLEYGKENGYIAMDGGQNGFCIDNEGYLWYTVTDKVLRFLPEELVKNSTIHIPIPHLASVFFSKNAIEWERHEISDSTLERNYYYNSVRFSMAAFSATRSDQISYQYRLKGLSEEWSQPTKITQQTFTNLNPGKYQIDIRCSFNESHWSPIVSSPVIIIHKAWWQTWWTYVFGLLAAVSILIYLTIFIVKQRQKRVIKRLSEQKRLNELRLQSVRSKHIPHFSGNALSNIEHFIFNADLRQANKYLSKYSRLMNITLRDADKASRSIEQELEYVNLYLELEKMRFGNSLDYSVTVDQTVDPQKEIPNMLLQTWVENAVKHGIRHKEGVGLILVTLLNLESRFIEITVEDNGVGREKAKELDTSGTGQGLKILTEQITIYNQFNKEKIELKIIDLTDMEGNASGTRFEMTVPFNYCFTISNN
jgi:hypothetical protein